MKPSIIIFADQEIERWRWYYVAEEQIVQVGEGPSAARFEAIEYEQLVLVIPGELTGSRRVRVVGRGHAQELQAEALFSVEDDIGAGIESVHGAIGRADKKGMRALIWINKQAMSKYKALLWEVGLEADRVLPNYLAVPQSDLETPIMTRMGDQILWRHQEIGASCSIDMQDQMRPEVIMQTLFECSETPSDPLEGAKSIDDKYRRMAMCVAMESDGLNLLQGAFSAKRVGLSQLKKPVVHLAACMGFAVLLFSSLNWMEGRVFRAESTYLRDETARIMQTAFPDIVRVTDPKAQLRARMPETGGKQDFLRLSALLRESLQADPAAEIALLSVRFEPSTEGLQVQIRFKQYEDLAVLRQRIEAAGGRVEEKGSAQAENGGRTGDIVVMAQ